MAVFEIQDASGKTYEIEAPDQAQALQAFQGFIGQSQPAPEQPAAPERGLGDVLYENIVGQGAVDTPGEQLGAYIGDIARSLPAGIARGAAGLADLPGQIAQGAGQLGAAGVETGLGALGVEADPTFLRGVETATAGILPPPIVRQTAADVTGGATEFRGETLPGQVAGTVGEFLPGAALGGLSPANLTRFGVVPGVASELAGQATAGTQLEPYARTAAALAAPAAIPSAARRATAALPGADPERVRQANILAQRGVRPTAGQATGIDALRRAEGTLQPSGAQLEDFTAGALRSIGSTSRRATPEALKAAETSIVQSMDDALKGVSVTPATQHAQAAIRVADDYAGRVPVGNLVPRIRGIAEEIADVATAPVPKPVDLSKIRQWRTDIGKYTVSPDGPTREAAHALRNLLDGMTDSALQAAGRADDLATLSTARRQYRNLIAIRDAASRAGEEAATGIITPARLQSAVTRTQGRSQYATGGGTDLAPLARAGAAVLSPASTVSPGGVRELSGLLRGALGAGGFAATGGSPFGLIAGLAAPSVGRSALRSAPIQQLLLDPASALAGGLRLAPGITAGNR